MSNRAINWGVLIAALGLAAGAAIFVAKAVASAEVRPLSERVGVVENQQKNDGEKLKRIDERVEKIFDVVVNRGGK